ncbi:hypothetical protein Plhal304r1_c055g0140761 [Plasmopara halstedii]
MRVRRNTRCARGLCVFIAFNGAHFHASSSLSVLQCLLHCIAAHGGIMRVAVSRDEYLYFRLCLKHTISFGRLPRRRNCRTCSRAPCISGQD